MKKLWIMFILLSCISFSLSATELYPEMTEREKEQFNEALDAQIEAAQRKINEIVEEFQEKKLVFDPAAKLKVDHATGMLKTKTILVNNFRNAPSIRSPKVREKLLSILKKSSITPQDLHELDKTVREERKKIQEASL